MSDFDFAREAAEERIVILQQQRDMLLAELQNVVRWHDQLGQKDVERMKSVIVIVSGWES